MISSQVIFTIIFSVAQSLSSFCSVVFVNQFIEIKNQIFEKLLWVHSFESKIAISFTSVFVDQFFASQSITGLLRFNQKGL